VIVEPIPVVEATPVATEPAPVEAEPVAEEPVVEQSRLVEATTVAAEPAPAAVVEATPVAEQIAVVEAVAVSTEAEPEPLAEAEPVVELGPEPVVEATPVANEPAPVAEAGPVVAPKLEPPAEIEAAHVKAEPAPAAEAEPVVEQIALVEVTPVAVEAEPVSVAEAEPVPVIAATAVEPPPVASPAPHESAPESPIKLNEVPDPLFALAVEIRAVQAARAAALGAPQESLGLLELAEAVAEPAPVAQAPSVGQTAPVAHSVPTSTPKETPAVEQPAAAAETLTAVALLTAPVAEETLIEEPVAPAPEPVVAPEPLAQPQHAALAPEPQTEPEGPTLPFAPMQNYTPATSRSILPVPPPPQILAADSGPRITLPGPTLPPALTRLQDANVLTVIGEQTAQRTKEALPPAKSGGVPGWLVSALVMIVLLSAGLAVVYFLLLPRTVADAKPAPIAAAAASTPAPTGGSSPLAKFVEVTGFRIVTSSADVNKKAEVQYLVVNHSDADISDANVFITLRSAKPGQAPLCRFSFKIPSLGPFEAKEMSSPIEKSPRALSLPDWQDVRAEVQISQ
jgi:hypothetical protein